MVWLGSNDIRLLESGATITKNQKERSLKKDRDMGEKSRATDGTLRPMTKQGLIWNYGWWQPIFIDMKQKGIDLENMGESLVETQTTYSTKLFL